MLKKLWNMEEHTEVTFDIEYKILPSGKFLPFLALEDILLTNWVCNISFSGGRVSVSWKARVGVAALKGNRGVC